jgi:hypothetical protein
MLYHSAESGDGAAANGKKQSRFARLYYYCRQIFYRLPRWVKVLAQPAVFMLWIFSVFKVDLWSIHERDESGAPGLQVLYSGSDSTRNLVVRLAFDHPVEQLFLGRRWLWQINGFIKSLNPANLISIVEMPRSVARFFRKANTVFVPNWVSGEIDITPDISSFLKNSSLNSDVRRIRNNHLQYEVSRDHALFDEFYHTMYRPHITQTHGSEAIIDDYLILKQDFHSRGELLLVTREGERIGGMLIMYVNGRALLWRLGIRDGSMEFIIDGAISALYYYSVLHLQKKGYSHADFGMSRSFVKDGVLQYKKKWGLCLNGKSLVGLRIDLLSRSERVFRFLCNNPFIHLKDGKLYGAVFSEEQGLTEEAVRQLYKKYYFSGLSRLVIYRWHDDGSDAGSVVPDDLESKVAIAMM